MSTHDARTMRAHAAHDARTCTHEARRTRAWRCSGCAKVLGVLSGGVLHMRHGAVHIIAHLPAMRRCERCGRWCMVEESGE